MKKVMYFMGCALFVAAMAVACGNNEEKAAEEQPAENNTEVKVEEQAAPAAEPVAADAAQTVGDNLKEEGENTANAAIDAAGKKATEKLTGAIQNL
jgi:hypothetical protein